jgi:hypothetical protein
VVLTGCQRQYPDLQGYFSLGFTAFQTTFGTTRHLPALTQRAHGAYSVIEEFVEGFLYQVQLTFCPVQFKCVLPK